MALGRYKNMSKPLGHPKDVIFNNPVNVKSREMLQEEDNTINEFFDNPNSMDKPIMNNISWKEFIYMMIGIVSIIIILVSA